MGAKTGTAWQAEIIQGLREELERKEAHLRNVEQTNKNMSDGWNK